MAEIDYEKAARNISEERISEAVYRIFEQNKSFTGQIELEVHCKDGIVKDVYEIRSRRKV